MIDGAEGTQCGLGSICTRRYRVTTRAVRAEEDDARFDHDAEHCIEGPNIWPWQLSSSFLAAAAAAAAAAGVMFVVLMLDGVMRRWMGRCQVRNIATLFSAVSRGSPSGFDDDVSSPSKSTSQKKYTYNETGPKAPLWSSSAYSGQDGTEVPKLNTRPSSWVVFFEIC